MLIIWWRSLYMSFITYVPVPWYCAHPHCIPLGWHLSPPPHPTQGPQQHPEPCAGMSLVSMLGILSPPTRVVFIHFSAHSASSSLNHSWSWQPAKESHLTSRTPVPYVLTTWICSVFYVYDGGGSIIIYGIPMSYTTSTLASRQLLSQLKLKHTQVMAIPVISYEARS